MDELVLCMDLKDLGDKFAGHYNVISNRPIFWMPRSIAETSKDYRHIIPYFCIYQPDTGKYLVYQRKNGGEKRLDGLWSMGWGGHINPEDMSDTFPKTVIECAKREMAEELPDLDFTQFPFNQLYYRHDSDTEVNRVHGCLALKVDYLGMPFVGDWRTQDEILKLNLEPWSATMLAYLSLRQEKWDEDVIKKGQRESV